MQLFELAPACLSDLHLPAGHQESEAAVCFAGPRLFAGLAVKLLVPVVGPELDLTKLVMECLA